MPNLPAAAIVVSVLTGKSSRFSERDVSSKSLDLRYRSVYIYMAQPYMEITRMLDRDLKRGSTEMLIMAMVEERPRHGYEIGKLIEQRSDGVLQFHVASLYPLLYRLEK